MQAIELPQQTVKDLTAETKKSPSAKPAQIRALTGIRFLPLALICFHHAHIRWTTLNGHFEVMAYKHFVAMFFVLSGFILTYRYSYVKDVGTSMHFYLARIARLWPMHAFCLLFLITLLPQVFQIKGAMLPVFLCNFLMIHSWVPISKYYFSYNAPSWSSATLSFFDVAFPFLFIIGQRSRFLILAGTALMAFGLICLGNVLHLPDMSQNLPSVHGLVYINPLARLPEFAVGVAAALSFKKIAHHIKVSAVTGTLLELLALALVAFVNLSCRDMKAAVTPYVTEAGAQWLAQGGIACVPFAILIIVLAIEKGLVSKLFATRWMGFLGDMSFALYMLHAPFAAYFSVNFHDEYTTFPSVIFFFASMLVCAHIMHRCIVQPMRKQFIKYGTRLLELKWPAPSREPSKPKSREKVVRQRWILAAEVLLATILFYFALPTINRISPAQAAALAQVAPVHDVRFGDWLECKCACAEHVQDQILLNSVWQASKPQWLNICLDARVLDESGHVIGTSHYSIDGRHQLVDRSALWLDTVRIALTDAKAKPTKVAVKLSLMKRKSIEPSSQFTGEVQDQEMIIPVSFADPSQAGNAGAP